MAKIQLAVFACVVTVFGILVARVINALTVNAHSLNVAESGEETPLGKEKGELFYFVQISDLHVSLFRDPERIPDLWKFCDENLKAIKPPVVVASGDLTDATKEQPMASQQYEEEWRQYSNVIDKCRNQTGAWLDIRGNHDTFNVPSAESEVNYFRMYSAQGRVHSHSYMYSVTQNNYTVNFVAVDGTNEPGTIKPYNFFGIIGHDEFAVLEKFKRESVSANATFWFGHYPTSTLLSPRPGMRELMKDGMAYLNGHLHTFFMLVPQMHTMHHSGLLELELGDWKDHRIYRILAMDNGLFSFLDLRLHQWPAILITNPKDSKYMQPTKEPLGKMAKSSHIRMLIFSPSEVTKCEFRIDDGEPQVCEEVDGPLYAAPWQPSLYSQGLHKLEVTASNRDHQTRTETIMFSLDGTKEPFTFGGRFALMSDAVIAAQCLFGLLFAAWIVPLCILRILHYRILGGVMVKPRISRRFGSRWIRGFWILAATDRVFIPIVAAMVYLLIGPWFFGELSDGQFGAIFLWGTIVGDVYQPGSLSYIYGAVLLLFFLTPSHLIIIHRICQRMDVLEGSRQKPGLGWIIAQNVPVVIIIGFQLMQTAILYTANGLLAVVLSPFRLWSILYVIGMILLAENLKPRHLLSASRVWGHAYTSQHSTHTHTETRRLDESDE